MRVKNVLRMMHVYLYYSITAPELCNKSPTVPIAGLGVPRSSRIGVSSLYINSTCTHLIVLWAINT